MIRLSIKGAKGGALVERLAQVWPAHRDSPNMKSIQIEDGRAFILSDKAHSKLMEGRELNVKIGDQSFSVRKV